MEGYIGEIRGFAGNFAPRTWALCDGQLLAISSFTALFSILGTTYGGDGRTTFALPDLRGRVPMHTGTGPGLSPRPLGQRSGQEVVTLNTLQMPSHFHAASLSATAIGSVTPEYSTDDAANVTPAAGDVPAKAATKPGLGTGVDVAAFGPNANTVSGAPLPVSLVGGNVTVAPTGGSQFHNNIQPYLVINWIICMTGIFPSRS